MDLRWREVRRILAIRLDSMGDVLLTTPAIHAIKETLPHSHITFMGSQVGAEVAELCSDVDDIIVYQAPWVDPFRKLPQDGRREIATIHLLKDMQFDGAVIFTTYHQSPLPAAYLCYLADIPLRHGATADGAGGLLTTRHKFSTEPLHEVERNLELVASIGMVTLRKDLVLDVDQEDLEEMVAELESHGFDFTRPLAVIHPGCNFQARTYPWGRYAEVADLLIERLNCQVVFTGAENEKEIVSDIRNRMGRSSISLAGQTSLRHLAALIKLADVVITNNTGPMHLAAAMKRPVVALFALTNPPEQWGPWMTPHRLLNKPTPCAYCYNHVCPVGHECLALVTPEEVVQAAGELIEENIGSHIRLGRPSR